MTYVYASVSYVEIINSCVYREKKAITFLPYSYVLHSGSFIQSGGLRQKSSTRFAAHKGSQMWRGGQGGLRLSTWGVFDEKESERRRERERP